MKRITTLLLCLLVSFATYAPFAHATDAMDKIIAIVNDDVITNSELDQAVQTALLQLRQQATQMPKEAELKSNVLEQLINKKLQLQAAERSGIKVNDADIDKAISGIANENKISAEDLYQRLGQEGMNIADYRREIKEQLTMQKLQQQEIVSRITVSPQEIDSYLSSKAWHSGSKMQYHIEDITVPMSETPSDEELSKAQQAAKFVKNELSSGKSLKQTATNATNKAFKLRTADLGWRQSQQIPTAFVDQVTHMQEKQVSNPIRTGNGLHILRLLSTRSDIGQTPNRKQVEQYLLRHKFEDAMQDWVSKLRNQAFITTPGNKHTNKYA